MNPSRGLSQTQAHERLKRDGYNELPSAKPKSLLAIVVQVVQEPMFLLLLACGALYMILGDYREGSILSSSILVIITITFYQYRKTERALEALRKLSSPRALVIRDGTEQRIAGREVVTGDVLIMQEGDRIAADARLFEGNDLLIDESLLTGESVPVSKSPDQPDADSIATAAAPSSHSEHQVFSGSMVLRGHGRAVVTATGIGTVVGRIGVSLQSHEPAPTRLQQEMKKTIRRLGIAGIALSILVTLSFVLTRGTLIEALLTGLSSAMAILPEEFPVVLTIFLALGAWRLSQRKVLTRDPAAIETLGSATVLCSDKTGTITENRMAVTAWSMGNGIHRLEEGGTAPTELTVTAALACPDQPIDPMDKAVMGFNNPPIEGYRTVSFKPFSRETMRITRVVATDGGLMAATKGAPEAIIGLCRVGDQEKRNLELIVTSMASEGLRVLGVAEGRPTSRDTNEDFNYSFVGFVGLEDPVRKEVPGAIEECRQAGVRVIMITGDYPVTAKSIAEKIGLDHHNIITGDQLDRMSDDELESAMAGTHLFARAVPEQKLRIVHALQARGEVVAMTGDGINDAPALKAADIGVAMGLKGTDVAREASSLVILDDHFASIVQAIRLGRRIYDNLVKAMMYILAIHIPIIGLSLVPAFFPNLPVLLFPLHIVFMELIIDPVCSVAFENEPGEKGLMNRPPRNIRERFFGQRQSVLSVINGTVILVMVLMVYFISLREGHTEGETRLIAFSSLILANIGFILSSLSKSRHIFQVLGERNPAVKIILGSALMTLAAVTFMPFLRDLFAFELPEWHHLVPGILGGFAVLTIFELMKWVRNRRAT